MNIKDKVVVITGGSSGFGKSLAEAFLKEEAIIIINSNNKKELKKFSKEIGIFGVCGDVTKEKDLINLARKTITKFGRIDIWINNAGLWIPHDLVENFDMERVGKMFNVNVFGVINGSRVALRYMKEINSGVILSIISDSALAERPMASTYCASKWAVNGFTKSIREENKNKNISIFSIYPGAMKTELFGNIKPENYDEMLDPKYVAEKVIENLKRDLPEEDLIIVE